MNAATSLVVIGDIESFASPTTICTDGEFVQVTIAPRFGSTQVYAWKARGRLSMTPAQICAAIAAQVEEAAALVSTPALVAWLLDCGFTLNV